MRSDLLIVTMVVLASASHARAQGLVFDDDAYLRQPSVSKEGARSGEELLPNIFKVDLKPYCPTVRQQGSVSSCVGWSVGYGAMTMLSAIRNDWAGDRETIDRHAFSAMFLYNQVRLGDCAFGAELHAAFTFAQEHGNVLYRDFAPDFDCDSLPAAMLSGKAGLNRIKSFSTLFSPDDRPDVKISRVKASLARKQPVVAGMVVLQNFLTLKNGDDTWYPQVGNTNTFGGHAMVVVGYDDARKAFEVMNSWGIGWANSGYVWIRYDDFAAYCKYAYIMSMEAVAGHYLEGTIEVRRPVAHVVGEGGPKVIFAPLAFNGKGSRYRLNAQKVALPLEFQLVADGLKKGSYLYIISFDQRMHPTVHWPRDENLNRQFINEYETAVVGEGPVVAPGAYHVFTLTDPGTEYLCVLNTASQITNLGSKLEQISVARGDIQQRLEKAIGNLVSDFGAYTDGERVAFYGAAPPQGVIPLIFEFDLKK